MLSQYPSPAGLPAALHSGALDFKPILLEDAGHFAKYFSCQTFRTCDYSVGAVYQWRAYFDTYYTVYADMLLQIACYEDSEYCYAFPAGPGDMDAALSAIETDAAARGLPLVFCFVPEEALPVLKTRYGEDIDITSHRDWADYLYLAEGLKTFAGKKYHGQKNHLNRFVKDHPGYAYVPVTRDNYETARDFLRAFKKETDLSEPIKQEEITRAQELLRDHFDLVLEAGYIEWNGEVIALSIGEIIGDTLFCHVEKAKREHAGAYQAIVSEFAKAVCREDTLYINREDDSGEEGLRASKMAYQPLKLLPKYWVRIPCR